jgi:hypothetical protein
LLEQNSHPPKPTWLNPERTESGNEPIFDAEVGRPSTRTVHDQQLMLGQNGFGNDNPETSGLGETNNVCDDMDDENQKSRMAHRIATKSLRISG